MTFWLKFWGIISLVLVEGFFSGSETAIISCDRLRLRQLTSGGHRLAGLIEKLLARPDRLLSTTLLGTNLSVIISSSLMAALLAGRLGDARGSMLATLIMMPAILIFGEILPKAIFRQYADFLVPIIAGPLIFFYFLFSPLIFLAAGITNIFLAVFKENSKRKNIFLSREEMAQFIEERGKSELFKEEKIEIIKRIFDFGGQTIDRIMVPLEKVRRLPADLPVTAALKETENDGYSRFPVFSGLQTNFIGYLEIKDLMTAAGEDNIDRFIKPLAIVPAFQKASGLLEDFIAEKSLMAKVVDEQGQVIGIVTREDLIEEVLGEIRDEFDK